jgi:hypothetical protein
MLTLAIAAVVAARGALQKFAKTTPKKQNLENSRDKKLAHARGC